MMEKFVDKIISKQLEEKIISRDEINIYRYGYMLVYEVVVNMIIAVVIAQVSGEWLLIALFFVIYIPLRSFCGGWHADKFWKCTIYSNMIIVVMLVIKDTVIDMNNVFLLISIFGVCSVCILSLAPMGTITKPISKDEKKLYSKKIRIIMSIQVIIYVIMIIIKCYEMLYLISFSYLTQFAMLIIEKLCRKNIEKTKEM